MAASYDTSDVARLAVSVVNASGVLADPTTVSLEVASPDGTVTTYNTAALTKEAVGRYAYNLSLTGAAPGLWRYRFTTTGTPALDKTDYFTVGRNSVTDMVRSIRRQLGDRSDRVWLAAAATSSATTLTVTDTSRFPTPGVIVEFDDNGAEIAITTAAGDGTTLTVMRGQEGTTARSHADTTPLLINPRVPRQTIEDDLLYIADNELLPHVWDAGEFTVQYDPSNDVYPLPVPGVYALPVAYQIYEDRHEPVHVELIPASQANNVDLPYGGFVIRNAYPQPVYISYRARPILGQLTGSLRQLVIMGAIAHRVMSEEAIHVGPGPSAVDKRIGDGSRMRAGAVMWQRFEQARTQLALQLTSSEGGNRSKLIRTRY